MRSTHFDKVHRSAGGSTREGTLPGPRHRSLWQVTGQADNGELRRVCIDKTRKSQRRSLKTIALDIVALDPFHPTQINAHSECGSENLAEADANVPAVIWVSLPRTSGIGRTEEG